MEFCFARQLHTFLYRKILRSEKVRERSISFSQLSLSQTKPAHFCWIFVSLKKKVEMIVNGAYLMCDVYVLLLYTDLPEKPVYLRSDLFPCRY